MKHIPLGPFEVSVIGLGCMNLSAGYGAADDEESAKLLHEALDRGCNFLDTAAIYGFGHNERLIGKTLNARRHEFILASKCGMTRDEQGLPKPSGRPEQLRATCEASLKNLQTEVIDLYYLHRVDADVPVEESVGLLGRLVEEGKIRTVGLSEVCSETLRRAHTEFPITALQSEYSLWSRTPERGVLTTCKALGITLVPFSPLGRGFLADSAHDVNELTEGDIRLSIARPRFEPQAFQANYKVLQPYLAFAKDIGCTPAQLALAWLLAKNHNSVVPIPGTRNRHHLADNLAAAEIQLSEAQVAELGELINEETITGARYSDAIMRSIDAERE